MAKKNKLVLLFDSGIGGTSIYNDIRSSALDCSFYYLSDSANIPYGDLPDSCLREISINLILKKVQEIKPDLVVIACNTASTLILEDLRHKINLPVVGVVPAIKTAGALTKTKKIALLATPATVNRAYTKNLIQEFALDCQIQLIGTSELVHIAENKIINQDFDRVAFQEILSQVSTGVDVIILGCTHFSFLKSDIANYFDNKIQVIDSCSAITSRVKYLLSSTSNSGARQNIYCDTRVIQPQLSTYVKSIGFNKYEVF